MLRLLQKAKRMRKIQFCDGISRPASFKLSRLPAGKVSVYSGCQTSHHKTVFIIFHLSYFSQVLIFSCVEYWLHLTDYYYYYTSVRGIFKFTSTFFYLKFLNFIELFSEVTDMKIND